MKNSSILLFLFVFIANVAFAQDSETRTLDSFHGVSSSTSVDVELKKGNKNEAVVTVKGVDLDKVHTEVERGILKIGMKKNKVWSWGKKKKVTVVVTYTDEIDYLSASSSSDIICDDVLTGRDLEIRVSSSADIVCEVDVENLDAAASSSGDIEISGTADEAELSASSSGDILGFDLEAKYVDARASSSGDVEITVTEELKAKASSSGDVTYKGNPKLKDVSKSSSGDVSRY